MIESRSQYTCIAEFKGGVQVKNIQNKYIIYSVFIFFLIWEQ